MAPVVYASSVGMFDAADADVASGRLLADATAHPLLGMLGAGIVGTSAALQLAKRGVSVALVEDGVVEALNVEDSPGVAVESTAAKLLDRL